MTASTIYRVFIIIRFLFLYEHLMRFEALDLLFLLEDSIERVAISFTFASTGNIVAYGETGVGRGS